MKNSCCYLVAIGVIASFFLFSGKAVAGWVLYDNFNSGYINPDLWNKVEPSQGAISVQDGKAKIVHPAGYANVSFWLGFRKNPDKIKAVRAKVFIESCSGDVRARIGGWFGKVGKNEYIFNQIAIQPSYRDINGSLSVLEWGTNRFLYELYWGEFENPIEVIGEEFIIETTFENPRAVRYSVDKLGSNTLKLRQHVSETDQYFKGIGTRSPTGEGPCVVYFDDVYVLYGE